MIDEILQEVYNDQQKQCVIVNIALNKRIEETEKAKTKLEDHHAKVGHLLLFRILCCCFVCIQLMGKMPVEY